MAQRVAKYGFGGGFLVTSKNALGLVWNVAPLGTVSAGRSCSYFVRFHRGKKTLWSIKQRIPVILMGCLFYWLPVNLRHNCGVNIFGDDGGGEGGRGESGVRDPLDAALEVPLDRRGAGRGGHLMGGRYGGHLPPPFKCRAEHSERGL